MGSGERSSQAEGMESKGPQAGGPSAGELGDSRTAVWPEHSERGK